MLYCTRNTYRLRLGRFSLSRNKLVLTSLIVVGLGLLLIFIPIAKNILANLNKANALTPTITSISPNSGSGAGESSVTITGTGFKTINSFSQIVSGYQHTCGISSTGLAYCWGRDNLGQLGDGGTNTDQSTPVQVSLPSGVTSFSKIAVGGSHTCAIGSDSKAYCWGSDSDGQLGDNATLAAKTTPEAVAQGAIPGGVNLIEIVAGNNYTCAIGSNSKAYCWGDDSQGELGNNASKTDSAIPVAVSMPVGVTFNQISAGYQHACAIGSNSKAYCWGDDAQGQIGNNASLTDMATPALVAFGTDIIVNISAGYLHTCALNEQASAYCWGDNAYGQKGNNTAPTDSPTPVAVTMPVGVYFNKISAGYQHACATKSLGGGGSTYCWGRDIAGELGDGGTNTQKNIPVAVTMPVGVIFNQISAGQDYTCAIGSDSKAYCWGSDTYGKLGDNATLSNTNTPGLVSTTNLGEVNNITAISFGGIAATSFTVDSDTQITATTPAHSAGSVSVVLTDLASNQITYNSFTYLATISSISPTSGPVAGGTSVTITGTGFITPGFFSQISSDGGHTCAIGSDSKAYCWGADYVGQLGDDATLADKSTPVQVSLPSGVTSFSQITAGGNHTCAIGSDSKAYCWGYDTYGQLGDGGTNTKKATPVQVSLPSGVTSFSQLSAGGSHTCAIGSDFKAYCWGMDNAGQLGDDATIENQSTPVQVSLPSGVTSFSQISGGGNHTCAIGSDSKAYCWGSDGSGQLGDGGTYTDKYTPVQVSLPSGVTSFSQITAGGNHTCAIGSDSKAYCWGNDNYGQLGDDATIENQSTPVQVSLPSGVTSFSQLSAGDLHTCAIGSDSKAYCWGSDGGGELGDGGTDTNQPIPVQVSLPSGVTSFSQFSAGGSHTCAIGSDSKSYCWGDDNYGRLGDGGTNTNKSTPVQVVANFNNITAISFGGIAATSFTVDSDTQITATTPAHSAGSVSVVLTDLASNQITYNSFTYLAFSISPTSGPAAGGTSVTITGTGFITPGFFSQISAGDLHTCAIGSDFKAYCWGSDNSGQLGDGGTYTNQSTPVQVSLPAGVTSFSQITAGGNHTCAIGSDSKSYCWGYDYYGQLGDNTNTYQSTPVQVSLPAGVTSFSQISAGRNHTCAIGSDSKAYCWGSDESSQLGDGGADINKSTPVQVSLPGGVTGFSQITAGGIHTCAIGSDSKAYCWGNGGSGKLGDNTNTNQSTPVQVSLPSGITSFSQVTAALNHTCAIGSDFKAYCWGYASSGQLGDGTYTNQSTPVQVSLPAGVTSFSQITAGGNHTCAIGSDSKSYCWGLNDEGQLGDGGANYSERAPVQVSLPSGVTSFSQISASYRHTCAIGSDSKAYCWGYDGNGELGDGGTNTNQPIPVQVVANFNNITAISFGGIAATSFTVDSDTQITATTPAHSAGSVSVVLTDLGSNNITYNSYTYVTAPTNPTSLTATPAIDAIALSWTAPANDGGSPITDYKIEYCESDSGGTCSGSWNIYSDGVSTTTSATVSGLYSPNHYTFKISAINAVGTSAPGSASTQLTSYITISSTATVSVNVTPTSSGALSTNSGTVTVSTNHPAGYTLGLSASSASTTLAGSGSSILASSGTQTSPTQLANNTWGYRIDNLGGFGSAVSSVLNSVASSTLTFAGVPALSSPNTVRARASAISNDILSVWFGVKTDLAKPSATYTNTITYTAVAN